MNAIVALPLSRADYAPYGDVISADDAPVPGVSANHGTAIKYAPVAALENRRAHATPNVSVFRATPVAALPFRVALLEKHPASTQMFVPMNASRFLLVVALGGDAPDLATLRAFVAGGTCGITYRPGTWHHPLLALDGPTDFAGLVWEDGTEGDCVEVRLASPVDVRTAT